MSVSALLASVHPDLSLLHPLRENIRDRNIGPAKGVAFHIAFEFYQCSCGKAKPDLRDDAKTPRRDSKILETPGSRAPYPSTVHSTR